MIDLEMAQPSVRLAKLETDSKDLGGFISSQCYNARFINFMSTPTYWL